MLTTAMYDAVNGIERALSVSNRAHCLVPPDGAPAGGDTSAAAAAAAHAVLSAVFPGRQTTLESALAADLALAPDANAAELGRAWGQSVGQQVVALRSTDGTQTAESLAGGSGTGKFPRTFTGTQFRHMTPFGIVSIDPYRSEGAPAFTSAEYAADLNEVKEIGSATDTNPERAAISRHWLAEGGTVRETGLWLKAALNVIEDRGTVHSLSDTVRLLALLGIAIADSVKLSWADKYDNQYWRPGEAVRHADSDGNPDTVGDANWNPRAGTCAGGATTSCSAFGGTPEHTSGTSTFAGAASTVLAGFYCPDAVTFSFAGEQPGAQPRTYSGFKEAAREAGRSRIYGGIHFQFSNDTGREAGKAIAQEILRTRLHSEADAPSGSSACASE
jgi:hypothetical protein